MDRAARAVDGLAALLGAQLFTRLSSFSLSIVIARFAPPAEYGISYVSLQLFATLSLYAQKEIFRRVAQRELGTSEGTARSACGVSRPADVGFGRRRESDPYGVVLD